METQAKEFVRIRTLLEIIVYFLGKPFELSFSKTDEEDDKDFLKALGTRFERLLHKRAGDNRFFDAQGPPITTDATAQEMFKKYIHDVWINDGIFEPGAVEGRGVLWIYVHVDEPVVIAPSNPNALVKKGKRIVKPKMKPTEVCFLCYCRCSQAHV